MPLSEEQVERALAVLVAVAGPTRAKRGCLSCCVDRDMDAGTIRYSEEWDSEDAFQRHLRSEDFQKVLVAMDLCYEEPRISLGETTITGGVEVLRGILQESSSE
jgi:quinol monooxygenase YgiN